MTTITYNSRNQLAVAEIKGKHSPTTRIYIFQNVIGDNWTVVSRHQGDRKDRFVSSYDDYDQAMDDYLERVSTATNDIAREEVWFT